MSLFTYQIDYGAGWVAASPEGEWNITPTRNDGQIFYRDIFDGDLTFVGDDYTSIVGSTDCEVLEFRILCDGVEYWVGQFKFPYAFDIDEDSCFLKGTPEVVDDYSCIMNNYETEQFISFAAGGPATQVRDCVGALLVDLGTNPHYFVASTASGNASYLETLLNGLNNLNCGLTISSSFMFRENFPNGDNYAASYGANNYITGAANRLEHIVAMDNSSLRVLFGGTVCQETEMFTFKEFEDALRNMLNAYWYIDQNGDFRIEHIRFFDVAFPESDFINAPDLQTLISSNGTSFAYRRNKYTYDSGELYDQEVWTYQHYDQTEGTITHSTDFQGVPLFYGPAVNQKSDCVPGVFKEKEIASPKFWTDIFWAYSLIAAGTVDTMTCPTGLCLMDRDSATTWIRCEAAIIGAGNIINMHLSTAGLQDNYQTYDRIFIDGDMNSGNVILFDTAKPLQLQEQIEFPVCCDDVPDPMNRIVTELGNGKVKAITIKQNSVEVELLY